ncbi:cortex morphogenetic protein CmpA [Salipaludibacillus agaradhaerens]|uniref:Cortex morphogenetic protein CmpA n=1 Tax=Salipaludibacillus agaradhaerens TaxID=76935 RepID=A0A9Q4B444_SALAG|nr:cortex morphogenetic protein CmpA [Salipaludibacillus agaradhaerens]MCR6109429.1 cortex morphogenetic protein CmpA [Bacillus sp. A301a_S52]UJW56589.1 cortex morphogenetic protein CmpA [Bacillus sp. A116_S68]MCR6097790.1 cortex morphogenetic protein CmpA [Salipaludibacillus agaradhaerens]MCR6105357.1 cortex morphogenetic protein CmpA [Salipaludibacillus agaradhaerens]MCR6116581.1 cortex morphogenetic protein CmpA [Salipaludibacillus agaradhaerens]
MPSWLKRQLQEAYDRRDLRRIRVLNQCWFYYKNSQTDTG